MMDIRLYQINRERDEERRALLSTETLARRGFGLKVIDSSIYDLRSRRRKHCGNQQYRFHFGRRWPASARGCAEESAQ